MLHSTLKAVVATLALVGASQAGAVDFTISPGGTVGFTLVGPTFYGLSDVYLAWDDVSPVPATYTIRTISTQANPNVPCNQPNGCPITTTLDFGQTADPTPSGNLQRINFQFYTSQGPSGAQLLFTNASAPVTITNLRLVNTVAQLVPEPTTWALMTVGFGMLAASLRYPRRRTAVVFAA